MSEMKFKKGDKVYSKTYKKIGEIIGIQKEPLKLIIVDFGQKEVAGDNSFLCCEDDLILERDMTRDELCKIPLAANDKVNHPAHYTAGKVECIDALESATVNLTGIEAVCTANAIKYLWRWKQKNGVEDLQKAKWYIERLIREQEDLKQ